MQLCGSGIPWLRPCAGPLICRVISCSTARLPQVSLSLSCCPEPEARAPLMGSASQWQSRDSKPSVPALCPVPLGVRGTTVISSEAAGNGLLSPLYRWSN